MSNSLTQWELEDAIRKLKQKKASGPDGVANKMLKHLGQGAKRTLIAIRVGTMAKYHRSGRKPTYNQSTRKATTKDKQEATDPLVFSAALENFLKGLSTED